MQQRSRTVARLWTALRRRDGGSAAVELVLVTPLLIIILLVAVGLGRMVSARLTTSDVAHQTARAASLARSSKQARSDANAVAKAAFRTARASCADVAVRINTGSFTPGSAVRVRVTCTARLGDLTMSGLPGKVAITSTAASPVDTYRGMR